MAVSKTNKLLNRALAAIRKDPVRRAEFNGAGEAKRRELVLAEVYKLAEKDASGIIQARKNRQTGTTILVVDGEKYGVDTDDGTMPYSTICEEHSHIVNHRTLALAKSHAADPVGWCEVCSDVKAGICRECGEKPGPKPTSKVVEVEENGFLNARRVPGTCTTCNLAFGSHKKK